MPSSTARTHVVEVLSVPKDGMLLVRIRGPIRGIGTHYGKGGTRPCLGDSRCRENHKKDRPVWKGYCPVDHWRESESAWFPMVLEVTSAAEEVLREKIEPGQLWALERDKDTSSGKKVLCHFVEQLAPVTPDFDPMPILRRMWLLDENPPSMENNVEPATVMPPLADAPPDVQDVLRKIGKKPPAPPRAQTARDIPSIAERFRNSPALNGNGQAH